MNPFSLAISFALICPAFLTVDAGDPPGAEESDWIYLENSEYRLGVIKSTGAGIGYLSRAGSSRNLLNHHDRGRLIQQSYYGDADGSHWGDRPWRFNPVQGGGYRNEIPELLEVRRENDTSLFCRSIPIHWATGKPASECRFEQEITLKDKMIHVRYRMRYDGETSHAPRHQELPAVFLDVSLYRLVYYEGSSPWKTEPLREIEPGQKNEYIQLGEHWAAYLDKDGIGLGVYVPRAENATCYRFRDGGVSDCSYLAPIATFGLTPGLKFEYEAWFTIGTAEEIRTRFRELATNSQE